MSLWRSLSRWIERVLFGVEQIDVAVDLTVEIEP